MEGRTELSPVEVVEAMVAMFDSGDVGRVAAVVDADYVDHQGAVGGPDGFERVVQAARSGYVELDVTIEDLVEGVDRVAVRLRWRGARRSGEVDERETIDIVRVAQGRAIEHWGGCS